MKNADSPSARRPSAALLAALLPALLTSACAPTRDAPPSEPPAPTHSLDYADGFGLSPSGPEDRAALPNCDHFLDVRWLRRLARHPYRRVDPDRADRVRSYWVGKAAVRVAAMGAGAPGEERELVVLEHWARPGRFTVFDMSAEGARARGEELDRILMTADKIRHGYWKRASDDVAGKGLRVTADRRYTLLTEGFAGEQTRYDEGLVAPTLGLAPPVPEGKRVCIRAPEAPRAGAGKE